MTTMFRYLLALALTLLPWGDAFAASGIVQITAKDAAGTTRNINVTSDSGAITGNLMWNNVICDPTTTTQCAAVDSSGILSVKSTTLSTKANQDTNAATTAHTCSTGGYSELGCLGQVDDDIKSPLAAGTNVIGGIFGSPNVTPTDCSIALTTGGSAQNIISAASTVHGFTIANIDTSAGSGEPVWISFTTTAAASTIASYPLAAPTATTFANLSSYTTPLGFGSNHAVSVIAATTGHKISCTQW